MIALKISRKYFPFWSRVKFLFGMTDGVLLKLPNITMEKGESLIIHSEALPDKGATTSVAVKRNDDGSLRVLFSPPSTTTNYIDVDSGTLDIDPELRSKIEGK